MDRKERFPLVNWPAMIHPADAVGYGGDVPACVMDVIQRKIDELREA